LAPDALPAPLRERVQGIDMRGSMGRIHLLVDELPAYVDIHARYYGPMVWVLMMLEQWFKRHPTAT